VAIPSARARHHRRVGVIAHQHARLGLERAGAARVDNHLDVASPVRGEKSEAERHDSMLNFLVGLHQSFQKALKAPVDQPRLAN
jgi:hypothetical protein